MEYKILMLLGLALIALLGCVELWMEVKKLKKSNAKFMHLNDTAIVEYEKYTKRLESCVKEKSDKIDELQSRCDALRNQVFNLHKCLNEQQSADMTKAYGKFGSGLQEPKTNGQ